MDNLNEKVHDEQRGRSALPHVVEPARSEQAPAWLDPSNPYWGRHRRNDEDDNN
jgi:hypothetical protein